MTSNSDSRLASLIQRVETLEAEKVKLTADIAEVYAEAKSDGFDTKAMRRVVAIRKMKAADRAELEANIDTYMKSLGMLSDTPLGRAAMERDGVA